MAVTNSITIEHWQQQRHELQNDLAEPITLDALTGPSGIVRQHEWLDDAGNKAGWLIVQRKRGHRHSIDDVLTAWYALQNSPKVSEHLDLGTGIGTVGLLTLWGMGETAKLRCVEAQEISYRLLQINIASNGLGERVEPSLGDLRDLSLERTFPLITGSPPYFPPGTGIIPDDSQKAHARFELRGDVSDYAKTAARHLAPDGWFVLCFPSAQNKRAIDSIRAAGLTVVKMREVIPRETLPSLFSLFACRHAGITASPMITEPPLVVRKQCGERTSEMEQARATFGW